MLVKDRNHLCWGHMFDESRQEGPFNLYVWLLKKKTQTEKWFTQHLIASQQSQNSISAL